jgi:hypothetical protein
MRAESAYIGARMVNHVWLIKFVCAVKRGTAPVASGLGECIDACAMTLFAMRIDFRHRKNDPFMAIPSKRMAATSLTSDLERRRNRRPSEASITAPLRGRGIA